MSELKPCPKCGRNNRLGLKRVGSFTADMPDQPYAVVCRDIGHDEYLGPEGFGKEQAMDLWDVGHSNPPQPLTAGVQAGPATSAGESADLRALSAANESIRRLTVGTDPAPAPAPGLPDLEPCPLCGGNEPDCRTCSYLRARSKLPALMAQVPLRLDPEQEINLLRGENQRLRLLIRGAASDIAHGYTGDAFVGLCDETEATMSNTRPTPAPAGEQAVGEPFTEQQLIDLRASATEADKQHARELLADEQAVGEVTVDRKMLEGLLAYKEHQLATAAPARIAAKDAEIERMQAGMQRDANRIRDLHTLIATLERALRYMLEETEHQDCDFPDICPNTQAKAALAEIEKWRAG